MFGRRLEVQEGIRGGSLKDGLGEEGALLVEFTESSHGSCWAAYGTLHIACGIVGAATVGTAGEGRPHLALMGENCRGRPNGDGSRVDKTLGLGFTDAEGEGEDINELYARHLSTIITPVGASNLSIRLGTQSGLTRTSAPLKLYFVLMLNLDPPKGVMELDLWTSYISGEEYHAIARVRPKSIGMVCRISNGALGGSTDFALVFRNSMMYSRVWWVSAFAWADVTNSFLHDILGRTPPLGP